MPQLIDHGTKVKYTLNGKEKTGIIHGHRTYQPEKGNIRMTYLIDTGKTVREDIGGEPTGRTVKVPHPFNENETLEVPELDPVVVRQPEQVEVDIASVKLA